MGEVYRARDPRLKREVALKVLPAELASDPERRERFEREAQTLAALNHPHIVTIFSVEEAEGLHFITMELVKGRSLGELISKNGLPLGRFLEMAIPLADAVSAAHEQGITHRDLKPGNLMVSDEGRLKILDFGLAKLKRELVQEGLSQLPTQPDTQEGRILGTIAYMSPEQAEGQAVDHRSDIFSIGVILYEMATGRRPFQGDTTASMLSSILRDQPTSATKVNPGIPHDLGKIIKRSLEKEPRRRIQTAIDVLNELEELKQEVDSGEIFETAPSRQRSRTKPWLLAAAMLVLTLALTAALMNIFRRPAESVLRFTNPVQVTSVVGVERYPTWSPEGQRVAYQSNQSGNLDIWMSQVAGGEAVNLTADYEGDDRFPRWSPDGSQIAFYSRREGNGVYVMSALGGRARKVASVNSIRDARFQWLADGKEIAYIVEEPGWFLDTVSLSSLETRRRPFSVPENQRCGESSLSPDGRTFTYVGGLGIGAALGQIFVLPASGGEPIPVTDGLTSDWGPTWSSDGRRLFFVSNRGGSMDLWQQRMDEDGMPVGEPGQITAGLLIRDAVFSADGSKLAYSRHRRVSNVWRIPIFGDRPATWADAKQLTFDEASAQQFDLSPDGKRLVVHSDRSGTLDLWLLPSEGGELERLTSSPTFEGHPHWSPGGREIAFHSYRSGNRDIFVIPADGGPARQLTNHTAVDYGPNWSPDGREIAFNSMRGGQLDIWTIPAEGGEPRQLTDQGIVVPVYSPDGTWIIARSFDFTRLWRIPSGGGEAEAITDSDGYYAAWSPDGKALYFWRAGNIWARSVEDGSEVAVAGLTERRGGPDECLVTDGTYLYFNWREDVGDIWVMDVVLE
jgi:Tol biopolymer transport system component/predicted Ser/Thr protein kinase